MLLGLMVTFVAMAQTKVSGVVIHAEDGEPVIGATVMVKDAKTGVRTDENGQFQINVLPGTMLRFSMVGLDPVEMKAKNGMRVTMNGIKELNEVMVVAYGATTKAQFTGSAAVVDTKAIEQLQSTNALDALSGHVAGVEIVNLTGDPTNSNPSIRMRGITSINAGTSPLIILDGIPYDGDMNTINNSDIESMTVLKDAAANALYGSRGANGVIVITTKRAKAGSGARVQLDAKWGSNMNARQNYETVGAGQYYEAHYNALKNYAMNAQGKSAPDAHVWANNNLINGGYGLGYNVYNVPTGQYMIGTNGKLNPNATMGNIVNFNGVDYLLRADNWQDEVLHNGLRQEYNISVTNATDKSNFLASVGYLDNQGIVDNSNFKRINGRLKADIQAKPWLKAGANVAYTHYEGESMDEDGSSGSSGNVFAYTNQIAPIYPLYVRDAEGNIMKDANGYTMYDFGGKNGSWVGKERPFLSNANPICDLMLNDNSFEGNAVNATAFAEVRFLKDFKFTTTNNVGVQETRHTSYTNPYYGSYATSNGLIYKTHTRSFSYDFQQLLSWAHKFGHHDVDVMVGHESYWHRYYYLSGGKSQMFSPDNLELDGAVVNGTPSSYQSSYNTEGYFARAQYNYNQRYFASASYRRDASSRFHPDNRWGNFYSAGAAWVMTEEDFMKDVDWVDFLKVKMSYGEQGNDNIGSYNYIDRYTIFNSVGKPAAIPSQMGNKDITWEKNANLNAGVEFDLFKGRLSGGVEYFWRKTSDMLFWFPLPSSMGFTGYYANIGDMKNHGIEVELNGTPIQTKKVRWNIGLNMTHFANEVSMLPEERKTTVLRDGTKGFASGNFFIGEGLSMYSFYMPEYAGVYNEQTWQQTGEAAYNPSMAGHSMWYVDVKDSEGNVTGRKTTTDYNVADDYLVGKMVPSLTGGFNTRLELYGFDLAADFTYSLGGKVYDSQYASFMGNPSASSRGDNIHVDLLNAWSATNQSSNIPRHQYDGGDEYATGTSSRFLTSANYLSLQNLTLGYTLPARLTNKFQISKVRLYLNCSNVWLWSARKGLDPRSALLTSTGYGSTNSTYYNQMRTISGGISVTF